MLLLGCLLVVGFSIAPRVMLVLAWLFSDRWQVVWSGEWLWPLLGIIFLPYTTIMYVLVWTANGIEGWDWIWIILGLLLDIMHWAQWFDKRREVPGYTSATAALGGSGSTAASSMAAPSSAPTSTRATPPVSAPTVTPSAAPAEVDKTPTEPKPASPGPGSPPADA